jgi:hypothetical protein
MAAWLLYVKKLAAQQHSLPLWRSYLALLPQERHMCCLLNYNRQEAAELQLPGLVVRRDSTVVVLLVVSLGSVQGAAVGTTAAYGSDNHSVVEQSDK